MLVPNNRVENLIATFNKLCQGDEVNPGNDAYRDDIPNDKLLCLLKSGAFLSADIKESELFRDKSKGDLIVQINSLYNLYHHIDNPYDKIIKLLFTQHPILDQRGNHSIFNYKGH
jgi:hypothetical protein